MNKQDRIGSHSADEKCNLKYIVSHSDPGNRNSVWPLLYQGKKNNLFVCLSNFREFGICLGIKGSKVVENKESGYK